METIFQDYKNLFYATAAICFILGIKKLSHPRTARNGNFIAIFGMFIAIAITLYIGPEKGDLSLYNILIAMAIGGSIGAVIALKVEMTAIPQMVAAFNGFGGAASALISSSEYIKGTDSSTTLIVPNITAMNPSIPSNCKFVVARIAPTITIPDIALDPDIRGV